jgi:hypothetical protein
MTGRREALCGLVMVHWSTSRASDRCCCKPSRKGTRYSLRYTIYRN